MKLRKESFPFILLLILSISLKCCCIPLVEVSYEDIENVNGTCEGSDSCEVSRPDTLKYYSCTCNSYCSLFGTCCVDSKHKHNYPKALKNLYCDSIFQDEQFYYLPMVYGCDPDVTSSETAEKLCNSNAELSSNPLLNVPVTDPVTGISYKNRYCFACNKNYGGEEPIPWNLQFDNHFGKVNVSISNLYFDASRRIWMMDHGQTNVTEVFMYVSLPEEVTEVAPYCYNSRIISECASNWTDDDIRNKCLSYMAMIRIPNYTDNGLYIEYYRNPHCAICNYQSYDNRDCNGWDDNHTVSYGRNDFFYGLFSLHDKTVKCEDSMVYDYFAKKCRKVYRARRKQT